MSELVLPIVLLASGAVVGAARRWIPNSAWIAGALCLVPVAGVALSMAFC